MCGRETRRRSNYIKRILTIFLISRIVMIRYKEIEFNFAPIFRVFISGSSGNGKTHFAYDLLKSRIFCFNRVYYFHPDFHETVPVDWKLGDTPILFQANLPTKEEVLNMPENSVIILDDLYQDACESKLVDYIYRVLSSKRKLHIITMTQRYFAQGRYSVNIRNSSNYHVLMRNADATVNPRAAAKMGLKNDITKATEINKDKYYPYIFVDRTPQSRVTEVQVYVDVFSKIKEVVIRSMKYYLLNELDFKASYSIKDESVAVKNENKTSKIHQSGKGVQESTCSEKETESHTNQWAKRKSLERQIKSVIYRYQKRSKVRHY